jgi:hypothetical protein
MIKLLMKVEQVYASRFGESIRVWGEIVEKQNLLKLSERARNLEEVDIFNDGYVIKYKELIKRFNELNREYIAIQKTFMELNTFHKLFFWLPFVKTNKATKKLAEEFLEKWENYQAGWS